MNKTGYYSGVDLVKIIAMYMIVVLHTLSRGGVLKSVPVESGRYWVAWALEIASYCAVNCFALATGFLMENRNVKYRRFIPLWLTVFAYSIIILILGSVLLEEFQWIDYFPYAFPITSRAYWYFTSYFCLFIFIPFINKMLDSLSRKQSMIILVAGFILFCVTKVLTIKNIDVFIMNKGHSTWWLMYLYIFGACIKRYDLFKKLSAIKALVGYIICVAVTLFAKYAVVKLIDADISKVSYFLENFYGNDRWIGDTSPTITFAAIFLFIFCLRLRYANWVAKFLKWLSPLTFAVYIIHTNPVIWNLVYKDLFVKIAEYGAVKMTLGVLGAALAVFTFCVLVDWIRSQLFKLLRVNKIVEKAADKIVGKLTKAPAEN